MHATRHSGLRDRLQPGASDPLAALKARVWISQGRLAEADAWARERSLSDEDDLNYLREYEHVTLARVLLARSATSGA